MHRARNFSGMMALQANDSVTDVRLEWKLEYQYAKHKANGKLQSKTCVRYAPVVQQKSAMAALVTRSSH